MNNKSLVLVCVSMAVSSVLCLPADKPTEKPGPSFGNLKYTFGSKDEIPAAFFDSTPLKTANTSVPAPVEVRVYPACQDGSGGMCVDAGRCPANLKPATSEPGACASGQECCFGAPENDRTCKSRGGECKPTKECGSAPTFLGAEDCDQKNGQICCILIA